MHVDAVKLYMGAAILKGIMGIFSGLIQLESTPHWKPGKIQVCHFFEKNTGLPLFPPGKIFATLTTTGWVRWTQNHVTLAAGHAYSTPSLW